MIQLLNIAEPQTAHSTSDWYTLTPSTLHHIIEKTHIHERHTQTIIRNTHTNMHTVNMRDSVFNNLTQQRDADCKTLFPGITFIITFLQVNISKWEWAEWVHLISVSQQQRLNFPFSKKETNSERLFMYKPRQTGNVSMYKYCLSVCVYMSSSGQLQQFLLHFHLFSKTATESWAMKRKMIYDSVLSRRAQRLSFEF